MVSINIRLHPINIGWLTKKNSAPKFVACTPCGIIELLKRYGKVCAW